MEAEVEVVAKEAEEEAEEEEEVEEAAAKKRQPEVKAPLGGKNHSWRKRRGTMWLVADQNVMRI